MNNDFILKAGDTIRAVFGYAKKSPFLTTFILGEFILALSLSGPISLLLWAILFMDAATFLGAVDAVPPDASGWCKLAKGFGVVLLVYGILLLVGVASNGADPLRPLSAMACRQEC